MGRIAVHLISIQRVLAEHGEMRQAAIAKAVNLPIATFLAGVKPGLRDGTVLDRREGRSVFYRLADGVEAPAAVEGEEGDEQQADPEFNASLWADGDLDLFGVIELAGGGVRVPAAGVRALCRLLHGQGPEL